MTQEQQINMALAYKGMSQAALARKIEMTPSNFNQKIKRGTFTHAEMEKIANVLDASYESHFKFPDGVHVGRSGREEVILELKATIADSIKSQRGSEEAK